MQICFVNEYASDEETTEDRQEFPVLAKEDLVRSNISKRVSQIIIPLGGLREGETECGPADTEPASVFRATVRELQARARRDLIQAREGANTRMVDITGDGVLDVILGYGTGADGYNIPGFVCDIYFSGQSPCLGGVLALDGRDGKELWRLWTEHEVFSLTCQADLDGDNVTDCLAGGRAGVFLAVSLKTGSMIWEFEDHAIKSDLVSQISSHEFRSHLWEFSDVCLRCSVRD